MVEDELKKGRLSGIYSWLRSKINVSRSREWKSYLPTAFCCGSMFISALYFSSLCVFLILVLCTHVARKMVNIIEGYQHKRVCILLSYAYAVVPSFSMLYLVSLKNSTDLIVWLFLLSLTIRVSTHIFESIFEGRILSQRLHSSRTTMGFLGSLLVSIPIGLVSSLFLRQRLIRFTLLNVFMALLIYVQDILDQWLEGQVGPVGKKDPLVKSYNGLALLTSFLAFLVLFRLIKT
jgi:hypothetical protein